MININSGDMILPQTLTPCACDILYDYESNSVKAHPCNE